MAPKKKRNSYALKHKDYLTLLSKSKKEQRRNQLLDAATGSEINAVSECVMNILNGNVPLNKTQLKQLRRHRNILRSLVMKKLPTRIKRDALKQKGGFLTTLLPLALSALTGLLPALLKR
jgi:hypothetical protein